MNDGPMFAVAMLALLSASNPAFSQDLPELLRKGTVGFLGASGTPAKVEVLGDRLIVELAPAQPPRIEIPIRQVQCDGFENSEHFFIKCYSGNCMIMTKDSMRFQTEIQMFKMPANLSAVAAEACRKLQNSLGGVITK